MIEPRERQQILSDVNRVATQQLVDGWRAGQRGDDFRGYVMDFFPLVADSWSHAAADIATTWYDESADLPYTAEPGPLPSEEQLQASASWALTAHGDDALIRLAGTLQRAVFDGSRNTILHNVARERGASWARHASANACEFCRMMATRGAAYRSRNTAAGKYHDHCHCIAVEVRPGGRYDPPPYVEQWQQQYQQARRLSGSSDPKQILAAWRQL